MSKKVSPIPHGFRTATPNLIVSSIDDAVAYYQQAFAAELINDALDDTQSCRVFATIKVGNSRLLLTLENIESGAISPLLGGHNSSRIHLYVEDVDTFWESVMDTGSVAIANPVDTLWGDRSGVFMDPFGHTWSVASRVESVSKAELQKRLEEARETAYPHYCESAEISEAAIAS